MILRGMALASSRTSWTKRRDGIEVVAVAAALDPIRSPVAGDERRNENDGNEAEVVAGEDGDGTRSDVGEAGGATRNGKRKNENVLSLSRVLLRKIRRGRGKAKHLDQAAPRAQHLDPSCHLEIKR